MTKGYQPWMGRLTILLPLVLAGCAPGTRMGADNGDDWDFGECDPQSVSTCKPDCRT